LVLRLELIFFYQALSKLSLLKVLFVSIKNDFLLFFRLKFDSALNNLLNNANGVKNKKNKKDRRIFGIIRLRTNEILNQKFSMILDILIEKTPNPDNIIHK